jgi:DNA primase
LEDSCLTSDRYTIHNIFERLSKRGDLWKDVGRHAQALPHKRAH